VKLSFFAACNSIYAHAKDLDKVVHQTLQQSYCLPILAHAETTAAVVKYTTCQEDELNASWNSVFFLNPVLVFKVLRLSLKPGQATPGNASKDLP